MPSELSSSPRRQPSCTQRPTSSRTRGCARQRLRLRIGRLCLHQAHCPWQEGRQLAPSPAKWSAAGATSLPLRCPRRAPPIATAAARTSVRLVEHATVLSRAQRERGGPERQARHGVSERRPAAFKREYLRRRRRMPTGRCSRAGGRSAPRSAASFQPPNVT